MALPTSVIAAGAGTGAANGTYSPATGANATYGGATQYYNGTYYICYSGGGIPGWSVSTIPNNNGYLQSTILYYAGGFVSSLPLTGWFTANTGGNAPTFTIGNTSNPNLTSMMVY